MSKRYRPSNGTAGDIFMSEFCEQCVKANMAEDSDRAPCPILGRMMGYGIDAPEYPDELTYDENNDPTCTAFVHEDDELTKAEPRCDATIDLFGAK